MRGSFDTDLHSSGHESDYDESSDNLSDRNHRSNHRLRQAASRDLTRSKLRPDQSASVRSSPSSSDDSDDEFTDLMGSSRDHAPHYDSLASCAPLSRPTDTGHKSTASLRRAFFSDLSPQPQDDVNNTAPINLPQERVGRVEPMRDQKGNGEEGIEKPEEGSRLLGVRRGSKGSYGGLRAVLFGSKVRSRTKSIAIDPGATSSPLESVISSGRRKRRLSSFQIEEESAQELTQSRSRLLPSASSSASSTPVRMSFTPASGASAGASAGEAGTTKQTSKGEKERPTLASSSSIFLSSAPPHSGSDVRRASADDRPIGRLDHRQPPAITAPKSQSVTLSIETDV